MATLGIFIHPICQTRWRHVQCGSDRWGGKMSAVVVFAVFLLIFTILKFLNVTSPPRPPKLMCSDSKFLELILKYCPQLNETWVKNERENLQRDVFPTGRGSSVSLIFSGSFPFLCAGFFWSLGVEFSSYRRSHHAVIRPRRIVLWLWRGKVCGIGLWSVGLVMREEEEEGVSVCVLGACLCAGSMCVWGRGVARVCVCSCLGARVCVLCVCLFVKHTHIHAYTRARVHTCVHACGE